MIEKMDRNMVQDCYDACQQDIREWEHKKQLLLETHSASGKILAKQIDMLLLQKKETLKGLKYALNNMT